MNIIEQLAGELKIRTTQAEAAVKLMDDGNTIPFIARYRKEATGGLDDQLLRELFERLTYLRNLEKRKEEVAAAIEGLELMTDEIRDMLTKAVTLAEVEDVYRPFKPKKKTRAGIAKEKGLQPLADFIMEQTLKEHDEEMIENVTAKVTEGVVKEVDYLLREREEKEEERYRMLDETMREIQKARQQVAAAEVEVKEKEEKKGFFRKKKKNKI